MASDVDEIVERCSGGWRDWYSVVTDIGDRYERLAGGTPVSRASGSAGDLLWRACMYYHYAQLFLSEMPELERLDRKGRWSSYKKAAPLVSPPAERVEVAFEGFTIPGYLRLPPGVEAPRCAILISGLESTKEENVLFERMCLDRGLATFAFDGPGQGEMFFQTRIRPDFERFTSAVIDYLETRPEIDGSKFGVIGRSLGGHYAPKSAANDERIAVCVCWGVLYELQSIWWDMAESTRDGFTYCSGETDPQPAKETLGIIDLLGWPEKIKGSLYLQHGMKDSLIPFYQVKRLEEEAVNAVEVITQYEPDGTHCCDNIGELSGILPTRRGLRAFDGFHQGLDYRLDWPRNRRYQLLRPP